MALLRIDALTWAAAVAPGPPPASAFFGERTRPEDVLVADADGAPAGYVKLGESIALPSHRHVLEIQGLAVDPARQGRGTGGRLVNEAVEEARRRGARKLSLRVLAPNLAARRLYAACGFAVEGVLRGEFLLDGRYVDDVLMARRLDG